MDNPDSSLGCVRKKFVKCRAVPFLGWSGDPVGRAEPLRDVDRERDVLSFDGPHRVDEDQFVIGEPKAIALTFAVSEVGMHIETVADGCGFEPSLIELVASELIDGDMAPVIAWH